MLRVLRRDGWSEVSIAGSHYQLVHPAKSGKVTVAMHRGDLDVKATANILKQG
jgi:predicted RNA binding protein YcfA (HicA-like mRNA interferase family)